VQTGTLIAPAKCRLQFPRAAASLRSDHASRRADLLSRVLAVINQRLLNYYYICDRSDSERDPTIVNHRDALRNW
jgi:hypothetical protein